MDEANTRYTLTANEQAPQSKYEFENSLMMNESGIIMNVQQVI